jgi:hypothetical protein
MERYIFVCFKRLRIVAVQKSMFVTLGYNTILYIRHENFFHQTVQHKNCRPFWLRGLRRATLEH